MKAPFPVTLFLSASAAFALPTGSYLTSRGKTGCPYNPSLTLPDERTVKVSTYLTVLTVRDPVHSTDLYSSLSSTPTKDSSPTRLASTTSPGDSMELTL